MNERYQYDPSLKERIGEINKRVKEDAVADRIADIAAQSAYKNDRPAWDHAATIAGQKFEEAEAVREAYTSGEQNNPDALEHMAEDVVTSNEREALQEEAEISRKLDGLKADYLKLAMRLESVIPQLKSPTAKRIFGLNVERLKDGDVLLENKQISTPIDLYGEYGDATVYANQEGVSASDLLLDKQILSSLTDEWDTVDANAQVTLKELGLARSDSERVRKIGRYLTP